MYVYGVHVYGVHVYGVHVYGVHVYGVHVYGVHVYGVRTCVWTDLRSLYTLTGIGHPYTSACAQFYSCSTSRRK